MLERELEPISKELPVDCATVTVDSTGESGDRYEASVHLEIPGPDIRVAASGYTLEAAWKKIARQIRETWKHRIDKRRQPKIPRLSAAHTRA